MSWPRINSTWNGVTGNKRRTNTLDSSGLNINSIAVKGCRAGKLKSQSQEGVEHVMEKWPRDTEKRRTSFCCTGQRGSGPCGGRCTDNDNDHCWATPSPSPPTPPTAILIQLRGQKSFPRDTEAHYPINGIFTQLWAHSFLQSENHHTLTGRHTVPRTKSCEYSVKLFIYKVFAEAKENGLIWLA